MTMTHQPVDAFTVWLEEREESDAGPTHRAQVNLRFEVDLAAPPGTPDWTLRDALLAAVTRLDRGMLLERVDYEADRFLPGDVRLVGADAGVARVRPARIGAAT